MAVLSRTWNILLGECDRLTEAGLDLTFEVHRLLSSSLRTALETNFTNILESIRLRTQVETDLICVSTLFRKKSGNHLDWRQNRISIVT